MPDAVPNAGPHSLDGTFHKLPPEILTRVLTEFFLA